MTIDDTFVALVTGASRGLGRGVARGLATKGATVYVAARTAGALDDVVIEIERLGGTGVAVPCDLRDDDDVRRLFHRIDGQSGRLDVLFNNAAAVHAEALVAPGGFWEKPLALADMIDVGLRSNYVCSYYAAPLMVAAKRGLIVSVSFYGSVSYFHGPAYGAAKAGTDKMMADMAQDLAPHGVAAVSLWPGFILTDFVKSVPKEHIPEEMRNNLAQWEHPEFTGWVIDALAKDPELMSMSGRTLIGAELGRRYGITDVDGKQPIDYRNTMGAPAQRILAYEG